VQHILNSAADLNAAAEKVRSGPEDFGRQLVRATKARLTSTCSAYIVTAENEDFGEEIKRAVERKLGSLPTQKQHKERVERARERYDDPQRERVRSALLAATLASHRDE
jgi:hypothetical protein